MMIARARRLSVHRFGCRSLYSLHRCCTHTNTQSRIDGSGSPSSSLLWERTHQDAMHGQTSSESL